MSYEQQRMNTLEATGIGSVEVPPDVAVVRLSVITEAATASEAARQNAARLRDVLDAVQALPIQDVSTIGLSLQPIFSFDPNTGVSSITGYRAENTIKVEADVEEAARVFDTGIAAGANTSSGISFRLSDERPHREEALQLAFRQAEADAMAVASAADVELLAPEELTVEAEGVFPRPPFEMARLADAPTPVLPSAITVSATVRVRFGILSIGQASAKG